MKRFSIAAALVTALGLGSATQARADTICYGTPNTAQEVPPPGVPSNGGGLVVVVLASDNSKITILVSLFDLDVTAITASHLHEGPAGTAGPVLFDIGGDYVTAQPVNATWNSPSAASVASLLAGNLYYNVHTNDNPSGDIRGQITCLP